MVIKMITFSSDGEVIDRKYLLEDAEEKGRRFTTGSFNERINTISQIRRFYDHAMSAMQLAEKNEYAGLVMLWEMVPLLRASEARNNMRSDCADYLVKCIESVKNYKELCWCVKHMQAIVGFMIYYSNRQNRVH